MPVERYAIGNVDLLRDCADITIDFRMGPEEASRAVASLLSPAPESARVARV